MIRKYQTRLSQSILRRLLEINFQYRPKSCTMEPENLATPRPHKDFLRSFSIIVASIYYWDLIDGYSLPHLEKLRFEIYRFRWDLRSQFPFSSAFLDVANKKYLKTGRTGKLYATKLFPATVLINVERLPDPRTATTDRFGHQQHHISLPATILTRPRNFLAVAIAATSTNA